MADKVLGGLVAKLIVGAKTSNKQKQAINMIFEKSHLVPSPSKKRIGVI
ncbi:MAG: hypothetical protein HQL52_14875 [Magnetococcales bacterium]|nr:hypothetical protein [Magnetococcales bacterium]